MPQPILNAFLCFSCFPSLFHVIPDSMNYAESKEWEGTKKGCGKKKYPIIYISTSIGVPLACPLTSPFISAGLGMCEPLVSL